VLGRTKEQPISLFNLHAKIFNDWIRQNVVRQLLSIGTRVVSAARFVDGNLEILSLPNVADTAKAQQLDRVFDGFALWIEHAGLQSYVNFGFHIVTRQAAERCESTMIELQILRHNVASGVANSIVFPPFDPR